MPPVETESPSDVSVSPTPTLEEKFASQLVGEMPRCPECSKILRRRHIDKCDYCGFHYGYLKTVFPTANLPMLESISDLGGVLSDGEKKGIQNYIKKIQSRYPQFHFNYFLLPLQTEVELQQMALWMLNQCPTNSPNETEQKRWTTLVLINTRTKKSAIATGYSAEAYLPDDSIWQTVSQLNDSMNGYSIDHAIHDSLDNLLSILDFSKKEVKTSLKKFKRRRS